VASVLLKDSTGSAAAGAADPLFENLALESCKCLAAAFLSLASMKRCLMAQELRSTAEDEHGESAYRRCKDVRVVTAKML
jgi:hypothetical protein